MTERAVSELSPLRQLTRRYLTVLVGLVVTMGALHLAWSKERQAGIYWFNLDKERNLPTWFSGATFFLFGCTALAAFVAERHRNREQAKATFLFPQLWLVVAGVGFAMSADEITILHENLFWKDVRLASQQLGGAWVYLTQWQIVFAPAVLMVVVFFTLFFANRFFATRRGLAFGFAGVGSWVVAFALEGIRGALKLDSAMSYDIEVLFEEQLEMIGGVLLVAAIANYTLDIVVGYDDALKERLARNTRFLTRTAATYLAIAFVSLGAIGASAYWFAKQQAAAGAPLSDLHQRALDLDEKPQKPTAKEKPAPQKPPTAAEISAGIERAVGYLRSACTKSGQFVYQINLAPDIKPPRDYNVLRHAGTIYALGQAYARHPEPETLDAMKRAGRFLRERTIAPVDGKPDLLAVWSRDELNHEGDPDEAKLGGTGLGLVALLSIEQAAPGFTEPEQLRALGRFLLFMQKEDGSFVSKYIPSEGGRDTSWTSLYYPGEAALGLVMLYEQLGERQWLEAAVKALTYLADSRRGKKSVEADHWALIATGRLLGAKPADGVTIPRELLQAHALQIVEAILDEQRSKPAAVRGAFTRDGRTTPAATRLEGLVAALSFLREDGSDLRKKVRRAIDRGTAFVLSTQVKSGDHAGAVPRAAGKLSKSHRDYSKSFNRQATEVRIDYVQHALSAFIGYEAIATGTPAPKPTP